MMIRYCVALGRTQAHRSRRLYRQRELRCRRWSWLDGIARLPRSQAVQVRRADCQRQGWSETGHGI